MVPPAVPQREPWSVTFRNEMGQIHMLLFERLRDTPGTRWWGDEVNRSSPSSALQMARADRMYAVRCAQKINTIAQG